MGFGVNQIERNLLLKYGHAKIVSNSKKTVSDWSDRITVHNELLYPLLNICMQSCNLTHIGHHSKKYKKIEQVMCSYA